MKPNIQGLHHDHIDGSRALLGILPELYYLSGKKFPFASHQALADSMSNPYEDIVKKFSVVTGVMQTPETLELAAYTYGAFRASEGLLYTEGKFAPYYHQQQGLNMAQVTKHIYTGLKKAQKECGIHITPSVCINREAGPDTGIEIAKIALSYDGEMVLDLVCDEANHPPAKHLPAYKLTFGSKVRRDCHAGEWVSAEPRDTYRSRLIENLMVAIFDLRCHSIGHAVPLADNVELVQYVVDNQIRIAGCPLSNLAGGGIKNVAELRIDYLLDCGVIYTLNPDDDLFMPTLSEVVEQCDAVYNFTETQCRQLEENVWKGAFGLR